MSNYFTKEGDRKEPYAEDSTRGKSLINPLNYKGDVLVQVWIDSRVLVILNSWLEMNGTHPRFLSEVVRRPLETLADHLITSGEVKNVVDNTIAARNLLTTRYNIGLNRGGRGKKNILHNQVLSNKREELSERLKHPLVVGRVIAEQLENLKPGDRIKVDAQVPMMEKETVKGDILSEAMKTYKELEDRDLKAMLERIDDKEK